MDYLLIKKDGRKTVYNVNTKFNKYELRLNEHCYEPVRIVNNKLVFGERGALLFQAIGSPLKNKYLKKHAQHKTGKVDEYVRMNLWPGSVRVEFKSKNSHCINYRLVLGDDADGFSWIDIMRGIKNSGREIIGVFDTIVKFTNDDGPILQLKRGVNKWVDLDFLVLMDKFTSGGQVKW